MKRINRKRIIEQLEITRGFLFQMKMKFEKDDRIGYMVADINHKNIDKLIVELGGESTLDII